VVFTNGIADKGAYRKFKMTLPGNDDFAHMNEVVTRRLAKSTQQKWRLPDLFLIDGGKGQLHAALTARDRATLQTPMIGLAKQFEHIVLHRQASGVQLNEEYLRKLKGHIVEESDDFMIVSLPHSAHLIKLLQRIRDESHRFAVSYHSTLKVKRQRQSILDSMPGIGPTTKRTLLRHFGSLAGIARASEQELADSIGVAKARVVYQHLKEIS